MKKKQNNLAKISTKKTNKLVKKVVSITKKKPVARKLKLGGKSATAKLMKKAITNVKKRFVNRKSNLKKTSILKPILVFVFVLCIISGFVFQNQAKKVVVDYTISKGNYYFNGGAYDTQRAEKYYQLALRVDPNVDLAYYQLSRIHLVGNKLDLARKEIDKALAINPENQRAFYVRGLIDGYDEKYPDAISDFQKFVAWAPTEWAGYNDLAWVYFLNKDFENTRKYAQEGLDKVDNENPWLLNGLGVAYVNLGEPQKAEEIFAKVKDISGDMTSEEWASAYPGNDPASMADIFQKFKTDVDLNTRLAMEGFTNGGVYASACSSSWCPCSANTCAGVLCAHYAGAYDCYGTKNCCVPNNCQASTCYLTTCPDGCGGWPVGQVHESCTPASNNLHCNGVSYPSPNGCGTCTGTLGPDCSGQGNVCSGVVYPSPNGCGTCTGTKPTTYAAVCSMGANTGFVCDKTNCGQTILTQPAHCTIQPSNGCPGPSTLTSLSSCPGCSNVTANCPTCSWKEVTP